MRDWDNDDRLRHILTPIATFEGSALADNELTLDSPSEKEYQDDLEFVAIAEGTKLPFYIFTYNIEMNQFAYTDLMAREDQLEIIDKSIAARHHAQFIS